MSYPDGAVAAEMATATADDVYIHRIQYVVTMYTSGLVPDHLRNLGNCSRAGQHAQSLHCGGVPSNVLARVHPWVSFNKSWLSFHLSCMPWRMATIIVDFVTRLNYASQILIMRHRAP